MKSSTARVAALALAATFTMVTFLSGCNTVKRASTEATTSPTSSAAKLDPYELDFYFQTTKSKDVAQVQEAMNKILKEKINATVVLHPMESGTYKDKTKLMFASGDKIDVISTASWLDYMPNVANNAYRAVDDLIADYGKDIVSTVGMDYIKGTAVNGKIYGIPVWKEKGSSYGLVFRKDLVDKYKFDLSKVKTYKDIEPMLQTIKEKEPDFTPLCESGSTVSTIIMQNKLFEVIGSIYGGVLPINATDYKLVDMYDNAEYMDALVWTHNMYEKGYINKSSLTDKESQSPMYTGKGFAMPQPLKPGKDAELSAQWGYPVVQVDLVAPYTPANQATGFMESIGVTSKNPQRAMMFINLLYSNKELLNTLVFGIEGTNYQKVNAATIDYVSGQDSKSVAWATYGWMFGNQLNNYLWKNEDPKKWEAYKTFNDSCKVSRILGFVFDNKSVSTEMAAINSIADQYTKAINGGIVEPKAAVAEFKAKLKAAGEEKVLAEKQKQIDEWVKANKK